MRPPTRINYLTNKYLLQQIHLSKLSYCELLEPQYGTYHLNVQDLREVTAKRIGADLEDFNSKQAKDYAKANRKAVMPDSMLVTPARFVVRLNTWSYIPKDVANTRPKGEGKCKAAVPFPPFEHWLYELREDGKYRHTLVGRSFWHGGFGNGHFDPERGKISNGLAKAFMLLVERFGRKGNWRGYSWNDEMQANALAQLCSSGLKFDESKGDNPFAFLTTTVNRVFIRTNSDELQHRDYRDEQLLMAGATPSISAQVEVDMRRMGLSQPKPIPAKRGRKPKAA